MVLQSLWSWPWCRSFFSTGLWGFNTQSRWVLLVFDSGFQWVSQWGPGFCGRGHSILIQGLPEESRANLFRRPYCLATSTGYYYIIQNYYSDPSITWTATFWAIILPTSGGLGTGDPKFYWVHCHRDKGFRFRLQVSGFWLGLLSRA